MKQRMMAEPLVVPETPLVDHHLVPTAPGAGPRKDRYPVFSSTTNAVRMHVHGHAASGVIFTGSMCPVRMC